ncbi:NHL repeat-containing protein [uncultured Hymenobacter sp.]|uniref:NHL repeat-containing protein n=1 Tax=uncultured Hymenobacter sp. TaxID=170016 RepID=UPI0035C95A6D
MHARASAILQFVVGCFFLFGWGLPVQGQSPAAVKTLVGLVKQVGSTDGTGTAARFNRPMGIAIAPDGTLYVADAGNHTIRCITPAGVVTTLAGAAGQSGSLDGTGAAARFFSPVGLALDAHGILYVTDAGNHTIRKVTAAGVVTTVAGTAGAKGSIDGVGSAARFNSPHSLTVAPDGALYVADTNNHLVRHITPTGQVSTWAGVAGHKGSVDGARPNARFFHPSGVALSPQGVLYVVDNGNHTVRVVDPREGVRTLAGVGGKKGHTDGPGAAARFHWPNGIAVGEQGQVYVVDHLNSTIRCVTPTGAVTTVAGQALHWGSQDAVGADARFEFPFGVATGGPGHKIYITDTKNQVVRVLE